MRSPQRRMHILCAIDPPEAIQKIFPGLFVEFGANCPADLFHGVGFPEVGHDSQLLKLFCALYVSCGKQLI